MRNPEDDFDESSPGNLSTLSPTLTNISSLGLEGLPKPVPCTFTCPNCTYPNIMSMWQRCLSCPVYIVKMAKEKCLKPRESAWCEVTLQVPLSSFNYVKMFTRNGVLEVPERLTPNYYSDVMQVEILASGRQNGYIRFPVFNNSNWVKILHEGDCVGKCQIIYDK